MLSFGQNECVRLFSWHNLIELDKREICWWNALKPLHTRKMPTSHVQNVFCLAHQIITSTLDYSHLGMLITIARSALPLLLSLLFRKPNRNLYRRETYYELSFLLNRIRFSDKKYRLRIERDENQNLPHFLSCPLLLTRSLARFAFSLSSMAELASNFPRYYEN